MKTTWFLIYLTLSSPYAAEKDRPFPLVKFADDLFQSEQECKDYFKSASYKMRPGVGEIVGFCLSGEALMLSPKQFAK